MVHGDIHKAGSGREEGAKATEARSAHQLPRGKVTRSFHTTLPPRFPSCQDVQNKASCSAITARRLLRTFQATINFPPLFPAPKSFTQISSLRYCPFAHLIHPLIFSRSEWGFRELNQLCLIYELTVTTAPWWKITLGADTVQLRRENFQAWSLSSHH